MAVTIYCASSSHIDLAYIAAAAEVGRELARRGETVVCGGGRAGLMGTLTDAALAAGGSVTGVLPRFMVERGWNHPALTETHVVEGMHPRKKMMMELAKGAIALAGGIGTFEELLEAMTWRQLGLFGGQVVILNTLGYYDPLLAMLRRAGEQGFMRPCEGALFHVAATPAEAVALALGDTEN